MAGAGHSRRPMVEDLVGSLTLMALLAVSLPSGSNQNDVRKPDVGDVEASMSNEPKSNDEARLSEADVRRIIERAIQLDSARTNEVTLAELRRVADEVGISPVALMQAFEENQLGKTTSTPLARPIEPSTNSWLSRARRLLRPAWLGSIATLLGLFTASVGAEEAALATFFMTGLGIHARSARDLGALQHPQRPGRS